MSETSFLQSADWATFQEFVGHKVREHDTVRFFESKIPGGSYLYCPHPTYTDAVSFLDSAIAFGREQRAWFVRIEPNVGSADLSWSTPEVVLHPTLPLQPSRTLEVSLSDDETMLAAMHSKTRYNIRVAEKAGVSVRFSHDEADVAMLIQLLEKTSERASIRLHPRAYYPTMVKMLGGTPELVNSKQETVNSSNRESVYSSPLTVRLSVEVALAEHNGKPVAGALLAWWGKRVIYLHGGSDYQHRALMAPQLLQWKAMQRARDAGRTTYDLGGIAPENQPHHPWAGITRFKLGFGGTPVDYPLAVDIVLNPFFYQSYTLLRSLRRLVG